MQRTEKITRALKHLSDDEEVLLADGFEEAFVGIARHFGIPFAVYNRKKCVVSLVMQGMSYVEAEEHFQFNVESAWVGENTPAFLET